MTAIPGVIKVEMIALPTRVTLLFKPSIVRNFVSEKGGNYGASKHLV